MCVERNETKREETFRVKMAMYNRKWPSYILGTCKSKCI